MRIFTLFLLLLTANAIFAGDNLAERLRKLPVDTIVLGPVKESPLAGMLARDAASLLRQANRADTLAWQQVKTRADWEKFREPRLQALRDSLGTLPQNAGAGTTTSVGTTKGDGFEVDNLFFESRPGFLATANLYHPAQPAKSMPGIIVVHSHHQAKNTGYRQDMGMTWARAGCVVMVPDLPGHGERRQHPFASEKDYPKPFPLGRQDYNFRFEASLQLYTMGDSLMGWLVHDLMRSLDVLLRQPGVDPKRIIVVSEPAGGGDVAAVFAALDARVTCVVVNNFGGPQPETPYPLPRDAEESFPFAGSGSWESTRSLARSAADGFLPWTILASIAPRQLVYYHEFYWDRESDPAWARLQKVYGFHGAAKNLTGFAGHGFVVGQPPANTHWIAYNREILYPVLEDWFKIANPKKEYSQRLPEKELECLTGKSPKRLHQVAAELGAERLRAARVKLAALPVVEKRTYLQKELGRLLGDVQPRDVVVRRIDADKLGEIRVERIHVQTEPGIVVPMVLLLPAVSAQRKVPLVIGLAQKGKETLLREKADDVAYLLQKDVAVCLPDLRGWGESSPGESRDRSGAITSVSASYLMVGQTMLGAQLRDLRGLMKYLRQRPEISVKNGIALWSESFAPPLPADRDFKIPHGADRPGMAEPSAALVALLTGLFENDVRVISVRGGLSSYASLLESPFVYVPLEAILPGVLTVGDIGDWFEALNVHGLRSLMPVDGRNRRLDSEAGRPSGEWLAQQLLK